MNVDVSVCKPSACQHTSLWPTTNWYDMYWCFSHSPKTHLRLQWPLSYHWVCTPSCGCWWTFCLLGLSTCLFVCSVCQLVACLPLFEPTETVSLVKLCLCVCLDVSLLDPMCVCVCACVCVCLICRLELRWDALVDKYQSNYSHTHIHTNSQTMISLSVPSPHLEGMRYFGSLPLIINETLKSWTLKFLSFHPNELHGALLLCRVSSSQLHVAHIVLTFSLELVMFPPKSVPCSISMFVTL